MRIEFDTDAGIANRARLGLVVLQEDETLEPEMARMTALPDVALYHTRIPMAPEIRPDTLAQMEQDLPAAARMLPSAAKPQVVGYGCTSAATVIGSDRVATAIQSVLPDAQVTDPLAAIIAAGRSLKVQKLGFLTPYVPDVSLRMRRKLEQAGFEIAGFGSFEEGDDRVVARISPRSIMAAAEQVAAQANCDAVVMSCTNLRCLAILPEMEAKLGRPVLSSNLALGWHMLRLAGIDEDLPQFGRLFQCHLPD